MKILELNGLKYSKAEFEDYKFRAKVKIKTVDDEHIVDIYTTDEDKANVENVLLGRRSDAVTSLHIFHWCTKEADDAATEMINEWLNENK